jgi:hypothetical protein
MFKKVPPKYLNFSALPFPEITASPGFGITGPSPCGSFLQGGIFPCQLGLAYAFSQGVNNNHIETHWYLGVCVLEQFGRYSLASTPNQALRTQSQCASIWLELLNNCYFLLYSYYTILARVCQPDMAQFMFNAWVDL